MQFKSAQEEHQAMNDEIQITMSNGPMTSTSLDSELVLLHAELCQQQAVVNALQQ
jgi:hypothetical protein